MKIAIIQASSQKDKNTIIEQCTRESVDIKKHEIINFGCFSEDTAEYSYVQIALCISILIESKSVDFVITGCSSGQGMMLACNSLPGIVCGLIENPTSAYLFGRINNGNVVSFPLGLNWGFAGEINLKATLNALFSEPFGIGYPKEDAIRKQSDANQIFKLNKLSKKSLIDILPYIDASLLDAFFECTNVSEYVFQNGCNRELLQALKCLKMNR